MKKKVCKNCRIFIEENICPICKKESFTTNWQGRMHFLDVKKSAIAQKVGITEKGEYAIKVR